MCRGAGEGGRRKGERGAAQLLRPFPSRAGPDRRLMRSPTADRCGPGAFSRTFFLARATLLFAQARVSVLSRRSSAAAKGHPL